jgi:hypothetical protein
LHPKIIDVAAPIVDYLMDLGPYSPRIAEDIPRKKRR